MELKKEFNIYLNASNLEAGPPISTILGNYGVNTVKFCENFNLFTKELGDYFLLKVYIKIYEDRTCEYFINMPAIVSFLRIIVFLKEIEKKERGIKKKYYVKYIKVEDLYLLIFLKFGKFEKEILYVMLGVLKSMSIYLEK